MDKLLSTKKVADYLDMNPMTVRRKAQTGEIPSIKIGNRLRFDKQRIDKWLMQRTRERPAHVLVVDDEPTVGKLIKNTLEMDECQVTTTLSSLEALQIINEKHFDLIFLDLLMSGLDGAELFRHIREIDKNVPTVIVTGYPHSEVLGRATEYGPYAVIKKPFMVNDILNTVSSFVKGGAAKRGK